MLSRLVAVAFATSAIVGVASCKVDVSASIDTTVDASSAPVDSGARAEAAAQPPVEVPEAGTDAGDAGACPKLRNAFDDPSLAGWTSTAGGANTLTYVTTDGKFLRAHTGPNETKTEKPEFPSSTRAQVESTPFPPVKKVVCKLRVRASTTAPVTYDVLALYVRAKDGAVRRYRAGYYRSQVFAEVDSVDDKGVCKQCPIPSKVSIATAPTPLAPGIWQDIELTVDDKGMTARDGTSTVTVALDPLGGDLDTFQVHAGIANLDTVPQDADFDELACSLDDC